MAKKAARRIMGANGRARLLVAKTKGGKRLATLPEIEAAAAAVDLAGEEKRAAFVKAFIETGSAAAAARAVGIAEATGQAWAKKDDIRAAIVSGVKALADLEAGKMLGVLAKIATDVTIPGSARVSAAVALLDRSSLKTEGPGQGVTVNVSVSGLLATVAKEREKRLSGVLDTAKNGEE